MIASTVGAARAEPTRHEYRHGADAPVPYGRTVYVRAEIVSNPLAGAGGDLGGAGRPRLPPPPAEAELAVESSPPQLQVECGAGAGPAAECVVCLETKPLRPFPNPECVHAYCAECLAQLIDGNVRLFPTCPQCRRPALDEGGSSVTSDAVIRAPAAAERPAGMRRVLARAVVRDGPEVWSATALGELEPGDYVEALEERICEGHRRVRIGDGIWVSRVTKSGRLLLDGPGPRTSILEGRNLCCMAFVHFSSLLAATALNAPSRRGPRGQSDALFFLSFVASICMSVFGLMLVGRATTRKGCCAACCALLPVNFAVCALALNWHGRNTALKAAAAAGGLMFPELFAVGLAAAAVEIVRLAGDGWWLVAGCLLVEVVCIWM